MKLKPIFIAAGILLTSMHLNAQTELKKPEASQAASVSQRIGLTDISVNYHSPLVKNRKVWGELVPYNEVWRAGANENTTITFSSAVEIEGKALAAGTYGLHMLPTEKEWTLIFSKNYFAWGSFFYDEKDDALRVKVNPKAEPMQDWLSYSFLNPQEKSVIVEMHWEKLAIPFQIDINVPESVYQNMAKELTNINGFFWQGHNQAATYCIQNNIHLEEAAKWIEQSIRIQKNFINLTTKSKLLEMQGKAAEAENIRKEAFAIADENQINTYGYALVGQGKTTEAVAIFALNAKRYPNSWNVYDSLAESLEMIGDKKGAISNYKIALSKAPDLQKKRIGGILKKLEGKS